MLILFRFVHSLSARLQAFGYIEAGFFLLLSRS